MNAFFMHEQRSVHIHHAQDLDTSFSKPLCIEWLTIAMPYLQHQPPAAFHLQEHADIHSLMKNLQ